MTIKGSLTSAGEYAVEEASMQTQDGVALDFSKQLSGIEIFEDLFSPFISGNLYVKDTFDLPNLFGKSGMNILRLRVSTPSFPDKTKIDSYFHVYKMSDRIESKKREQTYILRFISIESLYDQKRISAFFSGSPHIVVKDILEKRLKTSKNYNFSETNNDVRFVSNFWTASKGIAYLSEHARKKTGVSNFLFFENRDGFNFVNISDLVEAPPIQKFDNFDHTATSISPDGHSVGLDVAKSFQNVLEFHADSVYDYMSDYDAGMIKTRLYIADPIQKRFDVRNYSLNADKAPILNKSLLYSNNVINITEPLISSKTRFYNNHGSGDSSNVEIIQNRVAQLRKLQSMKIEIQVLGRTDYTVGKKVYFDTNKMMPISKGDGDIDDKLFCGYYLISAINHAFTADKHICTLELIKDSTQLT
jgi:hypothetical protein